MAPRSLTTHTFHLVVDLTPWVEHTWQWLLSLRPASAETVKIELHV